MEISVEKRIGKFRRVRRTKRKKKAQCGESFWLPIATKNLRELFGLDLELKAAAA